MGGGSVTPMSGIVLVRESQPSDLRCTLVFEGGSQMTHVTNLRSVCIYTERHIHTYTENILFQVLRIKNCQFPFCVFPFFFLIPILVLRKKELPISLLCLSFLFSLPSFGGSNRDTEEEYE